MEFRTWLLSTDQRVFPTTVPPGRSRPPVLLGARNEQLSLQVAAYSAGTDPRKVTVRVQAPSGWGVRVRRVGYVPMRHRNTVLSADPLDLVGGAELVDDPRRVKLAGSGVRLHAFQ